MISDQMRRLLAGYATNSLTEDERKSLFQASLDDQEIFNALHEEQALKDLLDDPASRVEIRAALDRSAADPQPAWWTRWWTWTAAAAAVAATVVIVTVVRQQQPVLAPPVASVQTPSQAIVPQPTDAGKAPELMRSEQKRAAAKPAQDELRSLKGAVSPSKARRVLSEPSRAIANAPAAPPPPKPALEVAQSGAPAPTAANEIPAPAAAPSALPEVARADTAATEQAERQTLRDRNQSAQVQSMNSALDARFVGTAAPIAYAIVRLDSNGKYQSLASGSETKPGDAVRLTVTPTASGFLTLSSRDASGNWNRIYPSFDRGLPVTAHVAYMLPDSPITIQQSGQWYRLTLYSSSQTAAATGGVQALSRTKAKLANSMKKETQSPQPVTVDLNLGPSRIP